MPKTKKELDNLIIEDVEDARAVVQGSMDLMEWDHHRLADETGYEKGTGKGVSPDTIKRFYDGITKYPRFQSVIRMLWGIGFHLVTYKR